MCVDTLKSNIEVVRSAMQKAELHHLEYEVITTAMMNIQSDPSMTIYDALVDAMIEWDVI